MQTIPIYAPVRSQGEEWREKFPRGIAAFIGVTQMFLTLGILACETISMLNGVRNGFLFIGYGTSFFYIIAWISIYGSLCCSGRCCITYTLVMEILCFCSSIVLLVFDIIFLQNPYECFLDYYNGCNLLSEYNYGTSWSLDSNYLGITENKIPAIKGQLAGAVLMLFTATLYIVIYIVTVVKIRRLHKLNRPSALTQLQTIPTITSFNQQQLPPQIQKQYDHNTPVVPLYRQQDISNIKQHQQQSLEQHLPMEQEIECYNCHHIVTLPLSTTTWDDNTY